MEGLKEATSVSLNQAEWQILLEILRAKVPDRDVWVFGSRATGKAKPYSDLDLGLAGTAALPLACEGELAEAFAESDLPFRVDVVDLFSVESSFSERVRRDGVLIQQGQRR